MRKLILKCGFSPGDVVMLTAAVRDLHRFHPRQFLTDVRTSCPELWENNAHITPLSDSDPEAEVINCSYPLINRCNRTPYHCLHGFCEFLNEQLRLEIKPSEFKGDIHLSAQEKAWYSQVQEVTREDTPFWIIAAGGKYDITIKWWHSERYQEVVDHFRGRIQFVQVGEWGHHHPKLEGVIDLRGQTSLRELIRLVHHSQGVLCSVTALMHLAASVETKRGQPIHRPCVVVAGGREPAYWEAYPGHQFIHTNGALPCCVNGGCWKDRIGRLNDGDERDKPGNRCVDVVHGLPHCMDMITADEVIRRIEMYFDGGVVKYLSRRQSVAAEQGVIATANNPYDNQPLNLHSAGAACERFVRAIPPYLDQYSGRGIVICGGGVKYFTNAWVCINLLRHLGCNLPIQLWFLGEKEMDERMKALVAPLGVECVDAFKTRKRFPVRLLSGWVLKPYAILHSRFREVLFLDADNVPVVNPAFLFDTPEYQAAGAIFWPDFGKGISEKAAPIWKSCGLRRPNEPEFESGQIVLDKQRCWPALSLAMWLNENADFYYQYLHGDKETFHLAFRKLKKSYSLVAKPIQSLCGTMCQHDFQGRRVFQHRNRNKWDLFPLNRPVEDFWFERECRDFLARLRSQWDGRVGSNSHFAQRFSRRPKRRTTPNRFEAVMISCAARNELRQRTLGNLAKTDWADTPVHVLVDESDEVAFQEKRAQRTYEALKESLERGPDYTLLLQDDLDFNRHIRGNLQNWNPLRTESLTLASLYNHQLRELALNLDDNARIVDPKSLLGSQALLISKETMAYLIRRWEKLVGPNGIRISLLAGRLRSPILVHAPSLVQRIKWPGSHASVFTEAVDFHPEWLAGRQDGSAF